MKIYIFGKEGLNENVPDLLKLIRELLKLKFKLTLNEVLRSQVQGIDQLRFQNLKSFEQIDTVISVGGDGTLLELITFTNNSNVPILALNAGRLGFLANLPLSATERILRQVTMDKKLFDARSLIHLNSEGIIPGNQSFALNEFAITKRDTSSMIVIHTYIDGEFLNSYWADGLIVSTPTGSTGYSLSAGGPLVMPQTGNFIIAPINPHSLTVRPVIVPDSSKIELKVEGRSKKVLISLDHRSESVPIGTKFELSRESFAVNLIKIDSSSYFNTLRNKLNWGLDSRN